MVHVQQIWIGHNIPQYFKNYYDNTMIHVQKYGLTTVV